MKFTYDAYRCLIKSLKERDYRFCTYNDETDKGKCVIFRHDVDFSPEKALCFAEIENSEGIFSTYFFLLTTEFYNVFSLRTIEAIRSIISLGHRIGLHFDEARYPECYGDPEKIKEKIIFESQVLETAVDVKIDVVSMHRPSRQIIDSDMKIPGMVNSYGKGFFEQYKYLSDSRRLWREPVEEVIESGRYDRLQILTHPFWYGDKESDLHDGVKSFVNSANLERYGFLADNITDIDNIMKPEEIAK